MTDDSVAWELSDTFNPAAVTKDGKIYVLYRAEDTPGTAIGMRTSRIGLAESDDGMEMKCQPTPVLYPAKDKMKKYDWPGGCEDPRVAITDEGIYVMMYTSWNRDVPRPLLPLRATLSIGRNTVRFLQKLLAADSRIWNVNPVLSVTKLTNGQPVITKINGKYLMYWGEKDGLRRHVR